MDIQKEKIAHEKHLLSQGVDFKYLPNIQYNELENVYELIEWGEEYSEALNEINSSWCTWQAAKAQSDKKIKLLLCDEHLQKCESPTGVFNSQYPDEEPCLICLAKEAKAKAVPEGFVLIKDDTKTVVAIERMVEQQVEASGMDSRRLERLDGWKIIEAAVKAQEPAND